MSISSTTRKAGPYTGNGSTTVLPFSFKVFTSADVRVVRTDLAGVESDLTLTTDYTVTLNADQDSNPGGTVTLVTAAASGFLTTITSEVDDLQPLVLTNAGGFYPSVINTALDRLTIMVQQVAEKVGRAVKVNISSTTTPDDLVASLQSAAADATVAAVEAEASAALAAASAASIPSMTGGADTVLVINPTNNGWLYKTATQMRTFLGLGSAAQSNTGDFQPADADIPTVAASQVEMEAGSEAALRSMSPLRVAQAIAALSPPGIGVGQTWQNVSGSRTSGTTYTNSTGKPITVICGQSGSGSASTLTVTVGGVSFGGQSTLSGGTIILSFVVPNGATYSATLGVAFTIWMELR